MTTPPAGIAEADWQASPAGVRTLMLSQQQEIQGLRQENEDLRVQLTTSASELASIWQRFGRSSRKSSNPPSSDGPGHRCAEALRATSRLNGAKAVAASDVASRAILDLSRSCCRSSALTRWWSSTRTPVVAAAPMSRVNSGATAASGD